MTQTTKSKLFNPKPVEKYCSLAHIATNRIFFTFNISRQPDKNRVCDVVQKLIDHVTTIERDRCVKLAEELLP